LADDQHLSADFGQPQIHLSLVVFENPQTGDFLSQGRGILLRIALGHPHEDDESALDGAGQFAGHRYSGARNPLDDGTHKNPFQISNKSYYEPDVSVCAAKNVSPGKKVATDETRIEHGWGSSSRIRGRSVAGLTIVDATME
jgi:hypothetical protein